MSKNEQNISQNHELNHESDERLKSDINGMRANCSRCENPKEHLSVRIVLTTMNLFINGATQLHS